MGWCVFSKELLGDLIRDTIRCSMPITTGRDTKIARNSQYSTDTTHVAHIRAGKQSIGMLLRNISFPCIAARDKGAAWKLLNGEIKTRKHFAAKHNSYQFLSVRYGV